MPLDSSTLFYCGFFLNSKIYDLNNKELPLILDYWKITTKDEFPPLVLKIIIALTFLRNESHGFLKKSLDYINTWPQMIVLLLDVSDLIIQCSIESLGQEISISHLSLCQYRAVGGCGEYLLDMLSIWWPFQGNIYFKHSYYQILLPKLIKIS